MNFVAIDFETANSERSSPCEIGLIIVEDYQIVERKSYLIRPMDNYFDAYNTFLHGIDESMVENEPEFDVIYDKIKPDLEGRPILAHNASFDISVLRHTLNLYRLDFPETQYSCTYQMSRETFKEQLLSFRLDAVCDYLDIEFEHHRALSDAEACAKVALKIFEDKEITKFDQISEKFRLRIGRLLKDSYKPSVVKHKSSSYKLSELEYDDSNFKPDNPFFGHTVVFTGTLQSMVRKEAQVKVLEIGGKCSNGVTSKTDYLIVGEQDYQKYGQGFKSSKIKKAEKLLMDGKIIELLTESQFLEMIDNE